MKGIEVNNDSKRRCIDYFGKILPEEKINIDTTGAANKVGTKKRMIMDLLNESNLIYYNLLIAEGITELDLFWINLDSRPVAFLTLTGEHSISDDILKFSRRIYRKAKKNLRSYFSQNFSYIFYFPVFKDNRIIKKASIYYYIKNQTFLNKGESIEHKKSKRQTSLSEVIPKFQKRSKFPLNSKKRLTSTDISENVYKLENPRRKLPFGKISTKNALNNLTGREWIKFTKSWYMHNPKQRNSKEMIHPAKFPETMIREFITFFTKPGEIILDPFLGSGSTLLAALQSQRSCFGIELTEKYTKIAKERLQLKKQSIPVFLNPIEKKFNYKIIKGDSRQLNKLISKTELVEFDFCITSPPYWDQLKRKSIRQKKRDRKELDTKYSERDDDLGNIDNYYIFLEEQLKVFAKVYHKLKNRGYLVIITNNVYKNSQLYPLAFDTVNYLTNKTIQNKLDLNSPWVLKDEKIWLQNDKALVALGVNSSWVGNRHHQYCLIFRKEE